MDRQKAKNFLLLPFAFLLLPFPLCIYRRKINEYIY